MLLEGVLVRMYLIGVVAVDAGIRPRHLDIIVFEFLALDHCVCWEYMCGVGWRGLYWEELKWDFRSRRFVGRRGRQKLIFR